MVLTSKQKEELHRSILDYLEANGFQDSFQAFQKETSLDVAPDKKGLLEKKWISVIRLQKKIMSLENRVQQLEEEATTHNGRKKNKGDALPRPPAQFSLQGHRGQINSVRFHPTFTLVASASDDATIKIWEYESGELEHTLKGHTNSVQDIDFSPQLLVSCSVDMTIKLWNLETYECAKTLYGHDHSISSVRFFPSGEKIISSSRDSTIKIWETSTGYCVKTVRPGSEVWIRGVAVGPLSTMAASASDDQIIRLWNMKTWEVSGELREHTHVIECLAFSPANVKTIITDEQGKKKTKR